MTKFALHISSLLLMLLACKHSVEPQLEPIDLYPLAVGNTWTYQYTQYDTLGTAYYSYQSVVQLYSDTLIDGVLWYAQDATKTELITSKSDGIYFRSANTPILWYKQPSRQSQTYALTGVLTMEVAPYAADTVRYQFFSLGRLEGVHLLVNHVGPARIYSYGYTGSGRRFLSLTSELISHSLN